MTAKSKPLERRALKLSEHARQMWVVDLPAGTSPERILESDFWVVCGGFLGRGDIIHAIDEAASVFYELMVREGRESNATGFISLSLLRTVELTPIAVGTDDKLPPGCTAQWLGESQKWAAVRGGQVLRSGFDTKSDALRYFGDLALAGVA